MKVLLGVSSSIAAHRALDVASALRKTGAEVRAVLTENVPHLIGPGAFDAITHQRTVTGLWGSAHAGDMDHLAATKWADVFAIVPATANTLAVLAHGIANDALGTFAVAWAKGPLLIAPAMNPDMWRNAAVQANVASLMARGHEFVGPVSGSTACDDVGLGRLAAVDEIVAAIIAAGERAGRPKLLAGKRVLITGGPTREFADRFRCVTNPSTGRQALSLAQQAILEGAEVTLILGPTELMLPSGVKVLRRITTAQEMLAATLAELPNQDAAIFAAAVSDWRPTTEFAGKLKKSEGENHLEMRLERTPDIAATCNQSRKSGQVFVGFAAETENLEGYAGEKMAKKGFSLVFANPIGETGAGFASHSNRGLLLRADGTKRDVATASKTQIARLILEELAPLLR